MVKRKTKTRVKVKAAKEYKYLKAYGIPIKNLNDFPRDNMVSRRDHQNLFYQFIITQQNLKSKYRHALLFAYPILAFPPYINDIHPVALKKDDCYNLLF